MARAVLAERLHARWPEIEQTATTRLHGISESENPADLEYSESLRTAISAALEYLLDGVERGEGRLPQPPAAVLVQARLAARMGISLDTVIRGCFAGYTLFGDFLVQEAEEGDLLQSAAIKCLLRAQANCFDRILATVTDEYNRQTAKAELGPGSTEERSAERVRRLLAGEQFDATELEYDLRGRHLGAIAKGAGAAEALRELASGFDRRLLAVRGEEETVWAWLGGRRNPDLGQLERIASSTWPSHLTLAIGEPAQGPAGWRLTHRQAKATLPIALRSPGSLVRYADVALLAATFRDELLVTSLSEIYLGPLEAGRDGGEVLRQTLRAYFAAERNASSAAAALGVDRSTVANRLRTIEEKIGRSLSANAAEMEIALRWREFDQTVHPRDAATV
jgi:hypothetical protein